MDENCNLLFEDLDNLNLSFNEILKNENLVNEYIKEKQKKFNYQNFLFDTLPNYTTYEIDSSTNLFNNVTYDNIQGVFEQIVNECPYSNTIDDNSYFINYPLHAISFEEQFRKKKDNDKIFAKDTTIENVINYIGEPLEFEFNDNKDYLKINSSLKINTEKDALKDKNELWNPSEYIIKIDNTNQLNPEKVDEFMEFCFNDNKITKNSVKLSILGLILNTKDKMILSR